MPQTVDITGFGKVNFPDNFTPEQIQQAIERDIVPNMGGNPVAKASASLDATARPGSQLNVGPGEELVPAQGAPNSPGFKPPSVVKAPLPADQSRFGTALLSEIPQDQGTRVRLIAEELFPGDPKGIERVGIRNGKPVYVNDDGQLQYVSGPLSRVGAAVTASAPEIVGSAVGSVLGGPALGSAAGGVVGRGAKRAASALLLDEPVTTAGVATELASEAAFSGIGGKLGDIGVSAFGRNKFIDPRALNRQSIRDAEQLIERVRSQTGIDLDLAQATGNRYLLELRDFVSKYPGRTSDIFQIRDAQAAGQFDKVAERVLDLVSIPVPAGAAGQRAINVADGVIRAAQKDLSSKVQPLYDAAYAAVPQITDVGLLNYLKLPYFDEAFKAGQRIAKLEGTSLGPGDLPDLRSFDYLKQGLDDVLSKLDGKGQAKEARALRERKNDLIDELDAKSGDLYKQARAAYQQGYKAEIEPLENGLVGTLARISPKNAETAARIFTDPSLSPQSIAMLKTSLSRTDPAAYTGLVRQYLAKEIDSAETVTQGSEVVNQAGKLYQRLFGSPSRRDKLKALLPSNALALAEDLFVVAEKLARTPLGANRIAGSQTANKQQLSEVLGSRIGPLIALATVSRQSARDAAQLAARERGVDQLAEALTNPTKRRLLESAVRIRDEARQRIVIGSILTSQVGEDLFRDLTENAQPGSGRR